MPIDIRPWEAAFREQFTHEDVKRLAYSAHPLSNLAGLKKAPARRKPRGKVPTPVRTSNGCVRYEWTTLADVPGIPPELLDRLAEYRKAEPEARELYVDDELSRSTLRWVRDDDGVSVYSWVDRELGVEYPIEPGRMQWVADMGAWFWFPADGGPRRRLIAPEPLERAAEPAPIGPWNVEQPVRATPAPYIHDIASPAVVGRVSIGVDLAGPSITVLPDYSMSPDTWRLVSSAELRWWARVGFDALARIGTAVAAWVYARWHDGPSDIDRGGDMHEALTVAVACQTLRTTEMVLHGQFLQPEGMVALYRRARRAELRRRVAVDERARRYAVVCEGDHPLDLDL